MIGGASFYSIFKGKKSNWGKLRGKGMVQKAGIQLWTAKQGEIEEKARENAMFSLASLGAEERI